MGSSPFSVLNGNRLIFVSWAEPGGVPRLQVLEISQEVLWPNQRPHVMLEIATRMKCDQSVPPHFDCTLLCPLQTMCCSE